VARRCKTVLETHYGSQFKGLVVYGSAARNPASLSSDIDSLVLLGRPFEYLGELRRTVELPYPMQLESDWLISVKPAPWHEFEHGSLQLYRKPSACFRQDEQDGQDFNPKLSGHGDVTTRGPRKATSPILRSCQNNTSSSLPMMALTKSVPILNMRNYPFAWLGHYLEET